MRRRAPAIAIPEDFRPNKTSIDFCSSRYPQVNIEATTERFIDWAQSDGALYVDWQATFRNCVRKGVENGWTSIVQLRKTTFVKTSDNKVVSMDQREFTALERLKERRAVIGLADFRDPGPGETSQQYRSAQEDEWTKRQVKRA